MELIAKVTGEQSVESCTFIWKPTHMTPVVRAWLNLDGRSGLQERKSASLQSHLKHKRTHHEEWTCEEHEALLQG